MKREDENSKRVNYEIKMFQGSRVLGFPNTLEEVSDAS